MTAGPFTDVPLIHWLPDRKRLWLRHGPIELVVEALGDEREVAMAYRQVVKRFKTVLAELVGELGWLRRSITLTPRPPLPEGEGVTCRAHDLSPLPLGRGVGVRGFEADSLPHHMHQTALHFHTNQFITPMICVAGAVADHILASMLDSRALDKAYVNNGGDIALHLAPSESFDVGVCDNPLNATLASHTHITADSGVGGIATSGWRGRSHSLGIADAVTVLAQNAATADTAATLIANAIDLPGHPAIQREQASELQPDSDLGERWVTTDVGKLAKDEIERALLQGKKLAQQMIDRGDIAAVYGSLKSGKFSISETYATEETIHA